MESIRRDLEQGSGVEMGFLRDKGSEVIILKWIPLHFLENINLTDLTAIIPQSERVLEQGALLPL